MSESDDWDNDDWEAPNLATDTPADDFGDEEDLSLKEAQAAAVIKSKAPKAATVSKQRAKAVIAKKEAAEKERQGRIATALKKAQTKSDRTLTEREKRNVLTRASDGNLIDELFDDDDGVQKRVSDDEADAAPQYEGEDLMGGGADAATATATSARAPKPPADPKEAFFEAVANLPMKTEMDHIEAAGVLAEKLNAGKNSTDVVQFIEFLIKAAESSLDSQQYKALASACNVMKSAKLKEEKVGKKKKKKSAKKICKMQSDMDYMNSYDDYDQDYDDGFM